MPKFPVDAPIRKVTRALENLGFKQVRIGNHISMIRQDPDGTKIPLTIPNPYDQKLNPSNNPDPERDLPRGILESLRRMTRRR